MAGLQLGALPQSFQDAIYVARCLGIDFVWIDALCIIQDDIEDREAEIGSMAYTFHAASVVLIAADAEDAYEGFLGRRPDRTQWRSIANDGSCDRLLWREACMHSHVNEYGWCNISRRAWTLQERLMARRALVFTDDTWIFDCRTSRTCECQKRDPHAWTPKAQCSYTLGNSHTIVKFYADPQEMREAFGTASHRDLNLVWMNVVEHYTKHEITHPRDKLPAIGALAACQMALRNDTYLAGIWEHGIEDQLAWLADPESCNADFERTREHDAPSWSWASSPGQVTFYPVLPISAAHRYSVRLTYADCTPMSASNPFGRISAGLLVLHGYYIDCEVHDFGLVNGISLRSLEGAEMQFHQSAERLAYSIDLHLKQYGQRINAGETGTSPRFKGSLLWLTEYSCLLLAPACRVPGAYQRVECLTQKSDSVHWLRDDEQLSDSPLTESRQSVASIAGVKYGEIKLV